MVISFRPINLGRLILAFTAIGHAAPVPEGKYESELTQAMLAQSAGECPAGLLIDPIREACDQQMQHQNLRSLFTELGAVKGVNFQGIKQLPGDSGRSAENYKVTFEHGEWFWFIDVTSTGKIQLLWAPAYPTFSSRTVSKR